MRPRALLLASAASATGFIAGWQLGSIGAVTGPVAQGGNQTVGGTTRSTDAATSDPGSTGTARSSDSNAATDSTAGASDASQATSSTDGTYTGSAVGTRFGDVQVQVTISGGSIADVTALQLTDHDRRSVMISNQAAPILRDEVLQAQAVSVSMVGGATYTSAAYLKSLQAALDQAGF